MVEQALQTTAERVCDWLWARDHATRSLGMEVVAVAPGRATLSMRVREDMLNGYQLCHGGFIASLADSAFAYACNACNERTVASGFSIDFLAPAHLGDLLTAHCVELSRGSRTGLYDAEIINQTGKRVAAFRGRSYAIKGRAAVD
jgi:acyl-CoA thioesterase